MQLDKAKPVIHIYKPVKINKTSFIYEIDKTHEIREPQPDDYFTEKVRIEKDQGYSKAKDIAYWLRIRNLNNWSKCKTPTGLFKTNRPNIFIGDLKANRGKTLIIFYLDEVNNLQIFKYPNGFYPNTKQRETIINEF